MDTTESLKNNSSVRRMVWRDRSGRRRVLRGPWGLEKAEGRQRRALRRRYPEKKEQPLTFLCVCLGPGTACRAPPHLTLASLTAGSSTTAPSDWEQHRVSARRARGFSRPPAHREARVRTRGGERPANSGLPSGRTPVPSGKAAEAQEGPTWALRCLPDPPPSPLAREDAPDPSVPRTGPG